MGTVILTGNDAKRRKREKRKKLGRKGWRMVSVWEGSIVNSLWMEGRNDGDKEQNKAVNVFVERHKHSLSPATITEQENVTEGISKPRK